jgi:hypothetical protein
MTMKTDLAALAQEKIDKKTAAKKAAEQQEAERKRHHAERAELLGQRLDTLEVEVKKKCEEAKLVQSRRVGDGFVLTFDREKLTIHVESLGDADVDFWGYASVQRWRRDFFLTPTGQFVEVRFKPNPRMSRPGSEQHPKDGHEFRRWAVDFAKSLAPISPHISGMAVGDFLHEAIAKLIELAG